MSIERDKHHILFNRRSWETTDVLKELREQSQLIVPMERPEHQLLHDSISHVPPLSYHIARRALFNFYQYDYTDNPVHAIDHLQWSIEDAAKNQRADKIEKGVADLAIFAVGLQKPFFQPNMGTTVIDLGQYRTQRRYEDTA